MTNRKTFLSISSPSEGEYVERKSKFFSYAFPVMDEAAIKEALEEIKKLHPKAKHICYAWRLGAAKDIYKVNDAGEPSNSAGQPILGQIKSFDLTNVIVIVVRYFGGTKLGIGGLVAAYRQAAQLALEKATIIEDYPKVSLRLETTYDELNALQNFLKSEDVIIVNQEFAQNCQIEIFVAKEDLSIFVNRIASFTKTKLLP